jgi:preprotein translocase subunit SecE
MAEDKKPKKPLKLKTPETVRERADKQSYKKNKPSHRLSQAKLPFKAFSRASKKEFNPVKVPGDKYGRVLNKRVPLMPKFLREAWAELKKVTWPTRREAARLTGAVVVFAVIFAIFVQALDLIFSKVIKVIILK